MVMRFIGRNQKRNIVVWENTMNKKRKIQVYRGKVIGGKLLGSYKSVKNAVKKNNL